MPGVKGIVTFLTEENNFANAALKVIQNVGNGEDIEEIKWMKNFKPAINEKYDKRSKRTS